MLILNIQIYCIYILNLRNETDWCLNGFSNSCTPLYNALKNTEVVTEARPHELITFVHPKPIHIEYLWGFFTNILTHIEPMLKIVTHIIANERQHCHRITSCYSYLTSRSCRCFGSQCCSNENSMIPFKGLIY